MTLSRHSLALAPGLHQGVHQPRPLLCRLGL